MAKQQFGLGKGVEALFSSMNDEEETSPVGNSTESSVPAGTPLMLDVSKLKPNPFQPRTEFDDAALEELAESILLQGGVKENLIVRKRESGGYEVISGHRRKAAVQYLIEKGENISHNLPCLVQKYDNEEDKMLNKIYGKKNVDKWDMEKRHNTYKHLIGREYSSMLEEKRKKGK